MIIFSTKSIFESTADVIVNPVNTVGVMGKGLALEFKNRFPHIFPIYQNFCKTKEFDIGKLMLLKGNDTQRILLFPTKKEWEKPSTIEYINIGLSKIIKTSSFKKFYSISFPKIGAGLGGLDFKKQVLPLLVHYFYESELLTVYIHVQAIDLKDLNICQSCKCFYESIPYEENNKIYIDYFQCPICGKKETTSGDMFYSERKKYLY